MTPTTVLPVQPGLTWDPSLAYPWLLYNTPLGMIYYDEIFGLNPWPPFGLVDPMLGTPLPITLSTNYSGLPPTDSTWLLNTVPLANDLYAAAYPLYVFLTTLPKLPVPLPPIPPGLLPSLLAKPIPGVPTVVVPTVLGATALLGL